MTEKPIRHGVFRIGNEDDGIILDSTHHPIVFCSWYGEMTEKLIDDLWLMRNDTSYRPSVEKCILVHFFDCKPPPATVRKRGAELGQNDPYIQDGTFVSVMRLKNPLLRGVMTAVLWMAGKENFPMEFAPDDEDAIKRAKRLLEDSGIAPPNIGSSYSIPTETVTQWALE